MDTLIPGNILVTNVYSENYEHHLVNFNNQTWETQLSISVSNWHYQNTYTFKIGFDIKQDSNYRFTSLSVYTDITILYLDFDKSIFFKKEIDLLVEMVSCAYNHSRMTFFNHYSNTEKSNPVLLPFKTLREIKALVVATDVYNKL